MPQVVHPKTPVKNVSYLRKITAKDVKVASAQSNRNEWVEKFHPLSRLKIMLVDSHIHVGQFTSFYISPNDISQLMDKIGVDCYAVSSTTICDENYEKVVSELHELIQLDGSKVLPVMWITPEGLKGNIAWFLESNIPWRCLKIHPELHPDDWPADENLMIEVIDIARELSLPLLIHTGNNDCCHANKYEALYQNNPDITFILAHGRPNIEAIRLAKQYDNVFVDSAFMPIYEMQTFLDNHISNKLLWGTDMCIPKHFFSHVNLRTYYQDKLAAFRKICTEEEFNNVTYRNAYRVFKISLNN